MNELVHASRPQGSAHCISDCHAGVDVADQLRLPLRCISPLFQEDDLGLLQRNMTVISRKEPYLELISERRLSV